MDINSINKTANLVHNNQMSLMIFQMRLDFGGKAPTFYGVNVFKVREVIEGKRFPVAETPNAHPLIEGMIQLRGNFIPVIDMPTWLGCPMTPEEKEKSVIIVSDFSHNIVGFRVAHIHGVEEKEWNELQAAENVNSSGVNRVVNQTKVKHNGQDELCYILDVESLLIECMPDMAEKLRPTLTAASWKSFYEGKQLLAADDSKAIRGYLATVFEQLGIPNRIFDDGKQLIDYMQTLKDASGISAIVTDLEMPEASGHTVIKFIRADNRFNKLPISVHSSMTSENNARDAKKLGADFFIGKIDTDEITRTLEAMTKIVH
jgi:two-component system chemotaxis response regulator CheV